MATVGIIGGGLAGLSTAYYLSKLAPLSSQIKKIVLVEASDRVGGWIKSSRMSDGVVVEHGPHTVRGYGAAAYNTLDMIEDIGLEDSLLPITRDHPGAHRRFIYANEGINELPTSVKEAFERSSLFSQRLAITFAKEIFRRRQKKGDESIYDFASRRFGNEVADYLFDPMVRGIFAGDARKLSVRSCLKILPEYEERYGSVVLGMLRAPSVSPTQKLARQFKENGWSMYSMERGMEQLPTQLQQHLQKDDRVHVHTNTACTALGFHGDRVTIDSDGGLGRGTEVDHVFSCCFAPVLASTLPARHQPLATKLQQIEAATVAVVTLEYEDQLYPFWAFGHLTPSFENTKIMGIIYASLLFPEHNATDRQTSRLTIMMGGAWYEEDIGDRNKDQILAMALDGAKRHFSTIGERKPFRSTVNVLRNCIPQYVIGHQEKLDAIDAYIGQHQLPITLCGSSYRGVAINDIILDARTQVESFLKVPSS